MELIRPEIKDGIKRAVLYLAHERSSEIYTVSPTQLINDLVFEEWQRKHPNMMFPNVDGEVIQIECTPVLVNP